MNEYEAILNIMEGKSNPLRSTYYSIAAESLNQAHVALLDVAKYDKDAKIKAKNVKKILDDVLGIIRNT